MEIQIPVYDYSELLDEAHDRIQEKLVLEGDDNIMESQNVFVDCVCESPAMAGLDYEQFKLLIHCVNKQISALEGLIELHKKADGIVLRDLIEDYENEVAEYKVIIDCLTEFIT